MPQPQSVVQSLPRPWTVTLVAITMAVMAALQGLRGLLWMALIETWQEVPLRTPWWLLAGFSLAWGGAFALWAWGWYRGKPWAWQRWWWLLLGYVVYQWFDRWLLSASPLVHQNAPFVLVRTLVVFSLAWWLWHHPKTRRYFGVLA